ncbi:MAG: hypothetical protein ACM359_06280 [Bacillota bacterium]
MRIGSALTLLWALVLLGVGGCASRAKPLPVYTGPTEPMPLVLEQIETNNKSLPTLFAQTYIEANIVDNKGKSRFVNTGGAVLIRKPRELLLVGRKDLAGRIFELGSTQDVFWMTIYLDENTRWWGHYRNLGKPCMEQIPVRPDLVGEVLGIGDISLDFNQPPIPTMTFNNDLDVYMVAWNANGPGFWYTEKQIWYDRKTLLPRKVLLYDQNGRVILRANLSQHRPVAVPDLPQEKWPRIATFYDLLFLQTNSTMTIRLSDMALHNDKGQPKPGAITFHPDREVKEIQIDEDCEK